MKEKKTPIERFLALDEEKKNRIINAAMEEFQYGYKKASTDAIVKIAGISKGLLYHYFGSKENLYGFLIDYAQNLMQEDYFNMMQLGQRDILESIWQMSLLRQDIIYTYPQIYNFLIAIQMYTEDSPKKEMIEQYNKKQKAMIEEIYDTCDLSLFRDDIDPKRAVDIIVCTLDSLQIVDNYMDLLNSNDDEYEKFLEELSKYLDTFRTCFYK